MIDPTVPYSIDIIEGKAITLGLGQTLQLNTELIPGNVKTTLTWSSSKTKVAEVDGNGLVTPKAVGKTKITVATHNKKKATITVKVVDPNKPDSVSITQGKKYTLKVGQTLQLNAVITPSTAQSPLTWKSKKAKVASVDANGVVTALKKGTTRITVTTSNKKKATITIKVVD